MYGGAAGGGKSVSLLASALQFIREPGYAAILIRRTFRDLNQPGGLIPLAREWLTGTPGAKWSATDCRWTFPNDATLSFGYLDNDRDTDQFQGAEFNFVGFDELTQFPQNRYTYMFSRLRKQKDSNVFLRMRSATNPGNIGHDWVKQRMLVEGPSKGRTFIPALLEDNPSLDRESYESALSELDPVTRARLRAGDWGIRPEGNLFKRAWFDVVPQVPPCRQIVRAWDLAATEQTQGNDPDYTVGVKMGIADDNTAYLMDLIRLRGSPSEVQSTVKQTAMLDGVGVSIRIEQEPGASGKTLIDHYQREVLHGFDCRPVSTTGDKVTRANPFSAACERGGVKLLARSWVSEFLDELTAFPMVAHDDQVDAAVYAYSELTGSLQMGSGFYVLSTAAK